MHPFNLSIFRFLKINSMYEIIKIPSLFTSEENDQEKKKTKEKKKNGEEIELRFCIYIYILFLKKILAHLKERKFGYVVKNEKRRKEGIRPKIGLPITLFHESMHEY